MLTTSATDTLGRIHDRSPLMRPEHMWAEWLVAELTDRSEIAEFIGPEVGQVPSNGPELIQPV